MMVTIELRADEEKQYSEAGEFAARIDAKARRIRDMLGCRVEVASADTNLNVFLAPGGIDVEGPGQVLAALDAIGDKVKP